MIQIKQGDITKEHVDAIVNAANSHLAHGGGVALAIARAAGEKLNQESATIDYVPTGSCVITTGGNLPAKYVIHAVGPVYKGGNSNEAELLALCITSSLTLAETKGLQSIAFPAISTGIYGYPIHEAAEVMITTVHNYFNKYVNSCITQVTFVLYSTHDYNVFLNEFNKLH